MRVLSHGLTVAAALALTAFAQNAEREMTCDGGSDSDLVSHCEINEMTIAGMNHVWVDGGLNGGMTIKGAARQDILVRARVQTSAETEAEAQSIARQIVIHTGGGRIIADGPTRERKRNWSVSYEILVPQRSDLTLKAHNGGIRISDVRGEIEFEALNGGVSLNRLAGNVHGHTANGGLSVVLAGERWEDGQLDASTVNGGVSMAVPDNYSARLETATVNGHIRVDFPVTVHGEIDHQLAIELGSGGSLVRAVTTNGGVSIKRKES